MAETKEIAEGMRRCTKCGEVKPTTVEYSTQRGRNGTQSSPKASLYGSNFPLLAGFCGGLTEAARGVGFRSRVSAD